MSWVSHNCNQLTVTFMQKALDVGPADERVCCICILYTISVLTFYIGCDYLGQKPHFVLLIKLLDKNLTIHRPIGGSTSNGVLLVHYCCSDSTCPACDAKI